MKRLTRRAFLSAPLLLAGDRNTAWNNLRPTVVRFFDALTLKVFPELKRLEMELNVLSLELKRSVADADRAFEALEKAWKEFRKCV